MPYPEELRLLVEDELERLTFSAEPGTARLVEAMRYSLLAGGKRIRPVLALATARAIGRDERELLPLAAAIELIHTYSLVHDDLPAVDDEHAVGDHGAGDGDEGRAGEGDGALLRARLQADAQRRDDEGQQFFHLYTSESYCAWASRA